ncbi:MAG: guanylate kinase, partial [Angelakisella sp.]
MNKPHGMLIVFSGPSGAGKGTILEEYFRRGNSAVYSISATTRKPRAGEVDGVHYHFVT